MTEIPLRILWNYGQYELVEAREKRTMFLKTQIAKYKIENTKAIWSRVENHLQNNCADLILSRAFMPVEKLLDFVFPYLKNNGQILMLNLEENKISSDEYSFISST